MAAPRSQHCLFATQATLTRAEFRTMTGLGERVATTTLSALIRQGYLATDSAYGPVRLAVPRHALRFCFPASGPAAEKDAALFDRARAPCADAGAGGQPKAIIGAGRRRYPRRCAWGRRADCPAANTP